MQTQKASPAKGLAFMAVIGLAAVVWLLPKPKGAEPPPAPVAQVAVVPTEADRVAFSQRMRELQTGMRRAVDAAARVGAEGNRLNTAEALQRTEQLLQVVSMEPMPAPLARDEGAKRVLAATRDAALTLSIGMQSAIRWNDNLKPSDAADMRRRVAMGRDQLARAEAELAAWSTNRP